MRIKKLFSRLSIGALLAAAIMVAANPAQAADEYRNVQRLVTKDKEVTIDFDEFDFGLESNDNPLYGGKKINNAWEADYGLRMDSTVNQLWLYDSNCEGSNCTGGDEDLATGKGSYTHKGNTIEYKSPEEGNVLIIQERNKDLDNEIKNLDKKIKNLDKNIKNLKKRIPNIKSWTNRKKKNQELKDKIQERANKIQERDNKIQKYIDNDLLRPDDNIGGTIKFEFTDEVGVLFDSIRLLDFDEHKTKDIEFAVKFVDDERLTTFGVGSDLIKSVDILSTDWDGNKIKDDNSLREYKFDFGDKRITEFHIDLPGSGAITGFNYARQGKNLRWAKRKVPEPTSILGLVAVSGLVASSLKRKRQSSNAEIIQ